MLGLLLTLRENYTLNRLFSFQNLRRKGGNFDHRPERPKVLLRRWRYVMFMDVVMFAHNERNSRCLFKKACTRGNL